MPGRCQVVLDDVRCEAEATEAIRNRHNDGSEDFFLHCAAHRHEAWEQVKFDLEEAVPGRDIATVGAVDIRLVPADVIQASLES